MKSILDLELEKVEARIDAFFKSGEGDAEDLMSLPKPVRFGLMYGASTETIRKFAERVMEVDRDKGER